jgi:dihydrofolate reductase
LELTFSLDIIDDPNGWSKDEGYVPGQPFAPPAFVLTHQIPDSVRLASQFTFVTDDIEKAIDRARALAAEKNVAVMAGGECTTMRLPRTD